MAFSLLNGLAGLGQGVAEYAGRAGLELQKADLAQQQTILADQLAGKREEAGDTRRAAIAADVAEKEHGFLGTQGDLNRQTQLQTTQMSTSATLGAANIHASVERERIAAEKQISIAANSQRQPFVDAQVAELKAKTDLSALQTTQIGRTLDLNTRMADEYAKPEPDQKVISSLSGQIKAFNYDPKVDAAILTAADGMATTSQAAVNSLITRETALISLVKAPELEPGGQAKAQAALDDVQAQLATARGRADYFTKIAQNRMAGATNTPLPGTAPPLPAGVPAGSRYNFDHKVFQAPDGKLFDTDGQPTTAAQILGGPRVQPATPKVDYLGTGGFMNGAGQR